MYGMEISNNILVEPIKNRNVGEIVKAHNAILKKLHKNNIKLSLMILDNKCSGEMKRAIKLNEMRFQLVPLEDHRKNHCRKRNPDIQGPLCGGLCGADVVFPV